MRKLNANLFFERCNIVHNYKYDYSLAVYKNTREKIVVICPEHGKFSQRPNILYNIIKNNIIEK